jgi:hypothetical protein
LRAGRVATGLDSLASQSIPMNVQKRQQKTISAPSHGATLLQSDIQATYAPAIAIRDAIAIDQGVARIAPATATDFPTTLKYRKYRIIQTN